jgi:hypothetical protein
MHSIEALKLRLEFEYGRLREKVPLETLKTLKQDDKKELAFKRHLQNANEKVKERQELLKSNILQCATLLDPYLRDDQKEVSSEDTKKAF